MLGHQDKQQELFVTSTWQELVPSDYILRRVDKVLDLSWLREEVADLYSSDRGRPSIDPEAAVRLMLAGFFHGIVHDRALLREARMHMGLRWFAGYGLKDSLPHHSTLTRLRQRWGAERFRRIFERTVRSCAEAGLVDAQTVHIDATLIRADVSWESLAREHSSKVWSEHEEGQLAQADSSGDSRSGGAGKGAKRSRGTKGKLRSSTDPEAALATSHPTWPAQPSYKQHTAVDSRSGVVLDAEVTTGDCHEGSQLIEQIDRVERCTGQEIQRVTTDAGYSSGTNFEQLESREIEAVIPASEPYRLAKIPAQRFRYDAHHDWVRCPRKKLLRRGSRNRKNTGWIYRARSQDCQACPLRSDCFSPTSRRRVILIADGYPALLRARRHKGNWSQEWKQAQRRHRWQVEGRHGEAKKHHGLRRAVRRGLDNVRIQAYLTAAVMNLKRLAAAAASSLDFWQLLEALLTALEPHQNLERTPRLSTCHA